MKQVIYDNYQELSVRTAEMIAELITGKPDALLCFPAGETSVGTFSHLIELNRSGKISFSRCRIVGLDEWAHLGTMKSENCFSFLKKHFFDHIDYSEENLCFFDGEAEDLGGECIKTDNFIKEHGPIDMMLLGAGMNGHLGLNEPGTPFNLRSHIVTLDETTRRVGQKYFSGDVVLTAGVSLGIQYVLETRMVILQLNGERKSEVAARLVKSEPDPSFPASALKLHANSYFLLDRDAAKLL
jgi:glucosamine-6-phosphate isomerase